MIMKDQELERIEAVFQTAADLPAAEREGYVARACEGAPGVAARVQAMLTDLDGGDSLALPHIEATEAEGLETEGPGTIIGRYKLLQEIGEGGFGVVYMAEQTEPIVRRVALKVIKLGMDTREVVARFEAERQALALMDHPNIARVLDGGATESGRPFFVMELVRGVSITRYCDENQLSTRERLRLFVDVCTAVQHAHHKGVIHRDLKPSNVLVTHHDGRPIPKVIDFGVAKAMHTRLTEKTLFTAYGRFIGTPAYMSPEQAELSGLDVDTRADIYSLGVLLYELLTGSTPFDLVGLFEEGLAAVQRTIREEPPERPSLRISTTDDVAVASRRGTDAPQLSRLLRGDLDWIVMKCLEKERGRRYETASELAADLERHLDGEPVLASPPSSVYRLRKFLARNRAMALALGVLFLGLVLGMLGLGTGFLEAAREREVAIAEAERWRGVTDFFVDTLSLSDPRVARTADLSVATLLGSASARASEVFADRPRAEGRLRIAIGRGYNALGERELAGVHLRRGIDLLRGTEGQAGYDGIEVYEAMWDLVNVLFYVEDPGALGYAMEARRVAHDEVRHVYPEVAAVLDEFIEAVNAASFSMEAEATARVPELFRESVRVTDRRIPAGDPLWPIVADSWIAAGYSIWYGALDPLTVDLFGRAAAVQERELPADHPDLAETIALHVNALNRNDRAAEAEGIIRATVERMRVVLPPGNPQLSFFESMLGETLAGRGDFAEAEPLLVAGYEDVLATAGGSETNFWVTEALLRLLRLYDAWDRPSAARPYREALRRACASTSFVMPWPHVRVAIGPEHEDVVLAMDAIQEHLGVAHSSFLARPGERPPEEIEEEIEALLPLARARFAGDETLHVILMRQLLVWAGGLAGYGELRHTLVAEGLPVLDPLRERFPAEVAHGHAQLAELQLARKERGAALASSLEAYRIVAGRSGDWILVKTRVRVARPLVLLGLHAEADELLGSAHESLEEHFGPADPDVEEARELRADNLERWGRTEEARALAPVEQAPRGD